MAFELHRTYPLPEQGWIYQEYIEPRLGTKHIHIAADSLENAAMIAFPTLPRNNDGRAHILEHIVLCGSQRFPVRNPFFAMTRRSLASFMNAMTYSDRTVYPFATQDPTDFFNLLDVYLDATFFPLIERHDFLQEGWRYELDAENRVGLHGVVFNEMKGEFSSPMRGVLKNINAALLPGTTYASESGGDPLAIPSLTHEDLKAFHATHYHPSRAVIYTFGPLDPLTIQARVQALVLERFHDDDALPRLVDDAVVPFDAPRCITVRKPAQGPGDEGMFQMAWLLGEQAQDPGLAALWVLFFNVVMDGASSPVGSVLENAGFGQPSGLMGVDDSGRYVTLHLGMEGLASEQVGDARRTIVTALEQIAQQGVAPDRLRNVLRDFELMLRDVGGGQIPHGLGRLLALPPVEMNGGDPLRMLDTGVALATLRAQALQPGFAQRMARWLLDARHRVEITVEADAGYFAARTAQEAEHLATVQARLTDAQAAALRADMADLQARQRRVPDPGSLPMIAPSSIVPTVQPGLEVREGPAALDGLSLNAPHPVRVVAPTNGVGVMALQVDASGLDLDGLHWAKLISELILDLGVGERDFQATDAWRAGLVGSTSASMDLMEAAAATGSALGLRFELSGKVLARDGALLAQALTETWRDVRWDETERVQFLIAQMCYRVQQSLSSVGYELAAKAARSTLSTLASVDHHQDGPAYLAFLSHVQQAMGSEVGQRTVLARLRAVHRQLRQASAWVVWVGDDDGAQALRTAQALLSDQPPARGWTAVEHPWADETLERKAPIALLGDGQVNHVAAAWPSPRRGEADVGPSVVLSSYLRNAFLHRALREEGGAYGGRSSCQPSFGAFEMGSFRDPHLGESLAAFDAAVAFAVDTLPTQAQVDEAIVSIMAALDRLQNPRTRAVEALNRARLGVTGDERQALRTAVLSCTPADLQRVARRIFAGVPQKAAFVQPGARAAAQGLGMVEQPLLPGGTDRDRGV